MSRYQKYIIKAGLGRTTMRVGMTCFRGWQRWWYGSGRYTWLYLLGTPLWNYARDTKRFKYKTGRQKYRQVECYIIAHQSWSTCLNYQCYVLFLVLEVSHTCLLCQYVMCHGVDPTVSPRKVFKNILHSNAVSTPYLART